MTKLRVVAEGLSKRYRLGILGSLFRKPTAKKELWALDDVSLDVEGGEALGVIGRNGAGKSTLLKVLCGVTTPTAGTIRRPKRVVPLIELTAGFHPELTGRDNVFLNGSLLGMSRRELAKRLDAIVDFSGVEAFLDTPAKKYSSGMLVRLAFSTAIHVDPELLLIDEVLSVGDLNFSLKAERATTKLRQSGVPMVVVSHNLGQIRNASTKAIWLDGGKVMARGKPDEVIAAYTRGIYAEAADASEGESYRTHSDPTVSITKVEVQNASGETPKTFETGEPLTVRVHYETQRATEPLELYMAIYNAETGAMLMDHNTRNDGVVHPGTTGASVGVGVMHLPRQPFHAGRYRISVIIAENHPDMACDWHEKMYGFAVGGGRVGYGVFHGFPEWRFDPVTPTVNT